MDKLTYNIDKLIASLRADGFTTKEILEYINRLEDLKN